MAASIVLALLSAFLFAAAGGLQHLATRSIAVRRGERRGWLPVLGLLSRILTDRVWLLGLLCNVLGFFTHSAALHLGSITIVQALLCVQLIFALPFARKVLVRDWLGTLAVCAGIATLILARGSVPQTLDRIGLVPIVCVTAMSLMALLVAIGRGFARTVMVGTAAGVGFSSSAVQIVVVTDRLLSRGPVALLADWHVYGLALSGLVAAILVQDAFASGSFPAAMTAMIIADPIASWVWGTVLFDEIPPATPMAIARLVLSGALISAGVATLAHSPTIRFDATREEAPAYTA